MKRYAKCVLQIFFIMALIVVLLGAVNEFVAYRVEYQIFVDGEKTQFTMPIVTIDDRTYIPLREAGEQLGWEVNWDESNKEIHMNSNQTNYLDSKEFIEEMGESQEGILESGRKYKYLAQKDFAMPNEEFIYNKFITTMKLFKYDVEDIPNTDPILTIEQAAEVGEKYLDDHIYPVDAINYIILYDFKNQVWVILEDVVNKGVTYGGDLLAIRKNGEVIGKYGSGGI